MILKIKPRKLRGKITVPPSKSLAHRAVICDALAGGDQSNISNLAMSKDIEATIAGMKKLMERFSALNAENVARASGEIKSSDEMSASLDEAIEIDCNESGSTLRFLIPIAAAIGGRYIFTGRGRLVTRPIDAYFDIFEQSGIDYKSEKGGLPLEFSGKLKPGVYKMPGDVSSQYISGMIFALSLLSEDSRLEITTKLESAPYIDLTLNVLRNFGIYVNISSSISKYTLKDEENKLENSKFASNELNKDHEISKLTLDSSASKSENSIFTSNNSEGVAKNSKYTSKSTVGVTEISEFTLNQDMDTANAGENENAVFERVTYEIPGGQKYKKVSYRVEGDWSQGAFFKVANYLGSQIELEDLHLDSSQGDKAICEIVERFTNGNGEEIVIDVSQIPDLVPIVAVGATQYKGTTKIVNAARLRIKESDRLSAITEELKKLGADIREYEDGLVINENINNKENKDTMLKGAKVYGHNDHRIAMAMAIASTVCEGEVIVENAECVSKSYPDFWEDFKKLGGIVDELNVG